MEEDSGLSESLIFERRTAGHSGLNAGEFGALDTLGALGYGSSLDHVADLDVDIIGCRERSFRFVKTDVATFLTVAGQNLGLLRRRMKGAFDDCNIKMIVEKVEDEDTVDRLLDHGVELAQGDCSASRADESGAVPRDQRDAA